MTKQKELLKRLEAEFVICADRQRAVEQQRYMKSQMPYFGVTMPEVKKITKQVLKEYVPEDNQEYRDALVYLFANAKQREVWYAGLVYAQRFTKYITEENIDVYEKIVRMTNWWDIVDLAAQNLIDAAFINNAYDRLLVTDAGKSVDESKLAPYAKNWIKDDDLWIRRTALLVQLKYKSATDFILLKKLILQAAHEKDFFMRKAIGWALRAYSYVEPQEVVSFITDNKDKLSTLSVREGLKVVKRKIQ